MKGLNWIHLVAISGALAGAAVAVACGGDEDGGPQCVGSSCGGSGGSGGSGGGPVGAVCEPGTCACEGECCPTEAVCYGSVPEGYGDECFAQRDQGENSANKDRLQYKLTWARSIEPPGNTNATVYQVLSSGANLQWPSGCNQSGLGIFIQLLDLDLTAADEADHRVRSGWAPNSAYPLNLGDPAPTDAQLTTHVEGQVQDGLCMVEDTYDAPDYNLPADQMTATTGWPEGLPEPMARGPRGQAATDPWEVKPAVLARIPTSEGDFNVKTQRQELIDRANELGVDGLTYIERDTGYSHSFVKQTWVIVTLGVPIAIPIREVETVYQVNDPTERACMGAYRSHALTAANDCLSAQDQTNPEWGWYRDEGGPAGQAPAVATGYFLITELEQVYSQTLNNSLCVTYPGESSPMVPVVEGEGFYDSTARSCVTANWDPSDPVNGIPEGNWCAATNSEATSDCHDAWRSVTYQTFQAFPVQSGTCPGL